MSETCWTMVVDSLCRALLPLAVAPRAEAEIVAALAAQVEGVLTALSASFAPAANVEATEGIPL
ncbi:hypothetical protein ELG87_19150 [Rhizobium leguminosarum]|uniref:hypothetical protein n=1 Tax=Rhizobium leguminosarum TaxID=384 RepID=UPI0010301C32|nr:hypothetical protein [Rhizobium leguminosarum]TBF58407.1 hypothetical protein ELG87_19150 [Rhizobium leguminosarum]